MKNALRFLWKQYISMILKANLVLGALVLALNYLFPRTEYFSVYLIMYPMFPIIFLVIYGYTLTTLYLNMALSYQCRRTDFFRASQVGFLITGVCCAALVWLVGLACNTFLDLSAMAAGGNTLLRAGLLWAKPKAVLFLLVMGLCLQPIGAALGILYEKHRVMTTVMLVVMMFTGIAASALSMFLADGTLPLPGWLLPVMGGVLAVLAVVGEIAFCRSSRNVVVR